MMSERWRPSRASRSVLDASVMSLMLLLPCMLFAETGTARETEGDTAEEDKEEFLGVKQSQNMVKLKGYDDKDIFDTTQCTMSAKRTVK